MQELWKMKLGWDDNIPLQNVEEWRKWIKDIPLIDQFTIKRRYFDCKRDEVYKFQLHIFSDSSEKAYGAVIYLRSESCYKVYVQQVFAKTHVAPIKKQTIPRLELMAAVLASKQYAKIIPIFSELFDIERVIFWCDSKIVLHWVLRRNSGEVFIKRRVDIIKEATEDVEWRYCPTKMNPADALSRGIQMKEMLERNWSEGPTWLQQEKDWPDVPLDLVQSDVESSNKQVSSTTSVHHVNSTKIIGLSSLVNAYSSLGKLLRVTAYVLRFLFNCRAKKKREGAINVDDKEEALMRWITVVQDEHFEDVKRTLSIGM